MSLAIQVQGVDRCLQKLKDLSKSVQRRIIRKGLRSALMVATRRGKSQVPRGPQGLLRKSLGYKIFKQKAGVFTAGGMIGPRTGFSRTVDHRKVDPVKYGHLVEGGTQAHRIVALQGKALAFRTKAVKRDVLAGVKGRRASSVYVDSVNHPGSRPQRFLQKIQVTSQSGMASAFRGKVLSELMREAAKAKPSEVDDGT